MGVQEVGNVPDARRTASVPDIWAFAPADDGPGPSQQILAVEDER